MNTAFKAVKWTLLCAAMAGYAAPRQAAAQEPAPAPAAGGTVTQSSHSSAQAEAGEPRADTSMSPTPDCGGSGGAGCGETSRFGHSACHPCRGPRGCERAKSPCHRPARIGHGHRDRRPGTAEGDVYRAVEEIGYRRSVRQAHEQPVGRGSGARRPRRVQARSDLLRGREIGCVSKWCTEATGEAG